MAEKQRTVEQGNDIVVLGTDQISEAAQFAGLDNDKGIYWGASSGGLLVRRNRRWEFRSDYMPPKDARPGVMFHSVRWPDSSGPWRDNQGDVWTRGNDGLLHTPETAPFTREHVEKKWGPLVPVTTDSGSAS